MRVAMKCAWLLVAAGCFGGSVAGAQAWTQPRVAGSVPVAEANATGVLMVSSGKNVLGGASVVTALDRPAHVSLDRGGGVLVCQTSVLHLTESQMGPADALVRGWTPKVLLALDRGAMEVKMPMYPDDALMTADLRFVNASTKYKAYPLDLAVLVTPNGDTCVENRGKKAPTLNITDSFGDASYQLKAGQHVMFEHGSLKAVNDRETSSCGCPPVMQQDMSIADAVLKGKPLTAKQQAKANPFPVAASEGLGPAGTIPQETSGTHVQVATTLTYDPATEKKAEPETPAVVPPEVTLASAPALPAAPVKATEGHGPMHSIGRFFKKIFAR